MLVVCNGAMKSGSTWLYNILAAMLETVPPPERYLTNSNRINTTIKPERLGEFLAQEDFRARDYLTKNHLSRPEHKALLLSFDDVYIVDIDRDVRDVVVSAFYDEKNREGYQGDFESFYWERGREIAAAVTRYHDLWEPDDVRILRVSYAELKRDFEAEVERLARFLSLALSPERIRELQAETSMNKLKERYKEEELYQGDRFFRKGIVGDWQNHFSERLIRDIEYIEKNGSTRLDHRALLRNLRIRVRSCVRKVVNQASALR